MLFIPSALNWRKRLWLQFIFWNAPTARRQLACIQANENVDKLAKAALNRASCSGKLICWCALKPKINAYIHSVWQKNWNTEGANKLHEVLPNLGKDLHRKGEGANRKREMAMCRLRVGTHGSPTATF
ncbi:RNA-directed DNA polymerase from transposon x-element [Plakobranchus ocellatus]|uniref:RNA-directed DNA polymerase from transposon x-element n=1 Tax=Plakobranchus ocellatus TaxID=259542 RepID=A0AAV4DS87_9GAST|nr:RNA-directed DNA polymerase from transposon x-element [Plakobranchus ocellatus]